MYISSAHFVVCGTSLWIFGMHAVALSGRKDWNVFNMMFMNFMVTASLGLLKGDDCSIISAEAESCGEVQQMIVECF